MHEVHRRLASFAPWTLLAVACGSPPPPAAPPKPAPVALAATPPPDLSPTPEPDGLILFARVTKPSEALKVIGGWAQMPMPGPEEVGALVAGEATGNALDLDQPIDFALAMHGRSPRGAISAAVHSMDEAKAAFSKYKLTPAPNGAFRIEGLGKPIDSEQDSDVDPGEARVCELVPSFGPATTRLICAESEGTLRDMAPWLARSAPRTTFPADLHVDLRLAPLRPLVAQMRRALPMLAGATLGVRRSGIPEMDEAFRAGIDDLADFTSDADTLAVDAMLGEQQATLTMNAQLRSTTSLVARLAVAHPERADVPPPSFWKLPGDSDLAYFHRGIDAADFEHPRDRLADILGGALAKDGVPEADRKALREAAAHTLDLVALRSTYAKGLDADATSKAIAAIKAVKPGDDAAREEAERVAAEKMAGWFVVGVDAPAARLAATEKEWAAAWARPSVVKWIASKSTDAPAPLVRTAAVPKGIAAKDAAHLEIVVYRAHHLPADAKKGARKPAPGKPIVLHALVVPDGGASWLVFAGDLDLAVAKAKELLAPGPAPLASRAGLASMKDARMNAGGFVSARAFAVGDVFAWTLSPERWGTLGHSALAGLASVPDRGTTPIPFQLASQPGGGSSPAGTFIATGTLPKGAIESLVRMAMHR